MTRSTQYVLGTNVGSALQVRGRNPRVETWAASIPVADQFVTARTMGETERGVVAKQEPTHLKGTSFADGSKIAFYQPSPDECCPST